MSRDYDYDEDGLPRRFALPDREGNLLAAGELLRESQEWASEVPYVERAQLKALQAIAHALVAIAQERR